MGLGGDNEPPKKKLKQAQLCFTPKTQKRKLVADVDDDVQFVKIICKEPAVDENVNINNKENHLSLNKSFPGEAEKKVKHDDESAEKSAPESNKPETSSVLTEENAFISPQDAKTPVTTNTPNDQKNTPDLSLSISDSVLDALNTTASLEDTNTTKDGETLVSSEKDNSESDAIPQEEEKHNTSELNDSFDDSGLNDTLKSDDGNDVTCLSSSNDDSTPNKRPSSLNSTRKLTPKRLESLKKKEELHRRKLEKRAQRAKLKEEKLRVLEEEKKRKQEERQKRKEEELKFKEEERKAKEEERRKKEEEKKQREERKEEKRKEKEEEKRKKEEIEEKKKAAFAKFFTKSNKQSEVQERSEDLSNNNFMPFPMKPDMKLASVVRRTLKSDEKELLDSWLGSGNEKEPCSYLTELRSGKHTPLKTEATWPVSMLEEEHDVIIIESTTNENCSDTQNDLCSSKEKKKKMKAKLLQFEDNRRPPYWGTWRKKSKAINPRKPFGQDKEVFDYDVDSDLEWEDEGEGEDIDKEGGDSDGDGSGEEEEAATEENGYILDNTFVPHGYLSDEEVQPDEDIDDNEPEDQKIRMKVLKQEFDEEMKTKTERLKPRLLGCVWISNGITEVSSGSLYEGLMAYRAVWDEEAGPIDVTGPIIEDSPSSTPQTKKIFPKNVLSSLVKFVHGCSLPLSAIIKEFLLLIEKEHPSEHVSKRAITLKVKEIAVKTYDYTTGKPTWSINPGLLGEFGLKPLNEMKPEPPPAIVPVQILEKPKESPLINFFKGSATPPVKKKVPFVTLSKPSFEYTPSKLNEHGAAKDFGTPRPNPGVRKRAQLITLSTSVGNSADKQKSTVPANGNEGSVSNPTNLKDEFINLCDNSN